MVDLLVEWNKGKAVFEEEIPQVEHALIDAELRFKRYGDQVFATIQGGSVVGLTKNLIEDAGAAFITLEGRIVTVAGHQFKWLGLSTEQPSVLVLEAPPSVPVVEPDPVVEPIPGAVGTVIGMTPGGTVDINGNLVNSAGNKLPDGSPVSTPIIVGGDPSVVIATSPTAPLTPPTGVYEAPVPVAPDVTPAVTADEPIDVATTTTPDTGADFVPLPDPSITTDPVTGLPTTIFGQPVVVVNTGDTTEAPTSVGVPVTDVEAATLPPAEVEVIETPTPAPDDSTPSVG